MGEEVEEGWNGLRTLHIHKLNTANNKGGLAGQESRHDQKKEKWYNNFGTEEASWVGG